MGLVRCGIGLLFLALFGVGFPGVVGNAAARLPAMKAFWCCILSSVIAGLDVATSVLSQDSQLELWSKALIYEPGLPVPVSARWNPSRKVFPNGCEQEEAMPL